MIRKRALIIIPVLAGLILGAFIFNSSVKGSLKVGDTAPNISMTSPDSVKIELNSLKGKYVLVDFWASWCGPCRKENQNLVRAYNKYKNKKLNASAGFTIYSVSLDTDMAVLRQAIKNDKLTWPNHVTDLKKWDSQSVTDYGVMALPANFLLDPNGKIIAKDLTGMALESELEKLLGE